MASHPFALKGLDNSFPTDRIVFQRKVMGIPKPEMNFYSLHAFFKANFTFLPIKGIVDAVLLIETYCHS
jgi:hypothetical protein